MVKEQEEREPLQLHHANGGAVQKAPAPDAKDMLSAKTMSIADQIANGLLTAGEHLQVGPFVFRLFFFLLHSVSFLKNIKTERISEILTFLESFDKNKMNKIKEILFFC